MEHPGIFEQKRRAVVTGAGKGIGRVIAFALAESGVEVAVVARTPGDIESVVGEIKARGHAAIGVECDVTDPAAVETLAERVGEGLGGVDILVNNAGSAESHPFLKHPDELWHRMIAANLTSVYYVTRAFLPAMVLQKWGRIINIASTAARVGAPYVAAYTAAKHGVLGLTRALAAELNPHNITVNAVCPGFADTPLTQASIANIVARTGRRDTEARAALEQMNPQKRLIDPEEVAAAVLFLVLETSRGITGQAINVDGGGVMS
jgi:NAD(P)-dependent dehydrogenase (short-subunit alcohol dehydrogenase family)